MTSSPMQKWERMLIAMGLAVVTMLPIAYFILTR
jgi:hypothetical protein